MLRNYFIVAFRNLWRNKVFSAINIFGLTLGIATCLLIVVFVQHELSYDRYNDKANRIARVTFHAKLAGGELKESNVMPPVAQTFKSEFPEVQEATRIRRFGEVTFIAGDKTFKEDGFAYVDSNFFSVFTLPLVLGSQNNPLPNPNSVVVTTEFAQRYFGNENPIGKILQVRDDKTVFTVSGVINPVPENSHFHFNIFASMAGLPEAHQPNWLSSNFYTYLLLQPGTDLKRLEAKLPGVMEKYMGPQFQQAMGMSISDYNKKGNQVSFALQPLTDIHLHSDYTGDLEPYGDIHYVYIFSVVAIFMLVIACINFMNLSTAGASKRSREVGIRKVLGSGKPQLIMQFLVESMIITFSALLLSLVLVYEALPWLSNLAGHNLTLSLRNNSWVIPSLVLFGIITGILAGSYPAFYLSSFNPVVVLKGLFSPGKKSIRLRSALVVFQFFISISLITGTMIVFKQLSFIQHKKLGYEKERVLIVQNTGALGKNENAFRDVLLKDPRISSLSISGYLPAGGSYNNNFFVHPDNQSAELMKTLNYEVDENYLTTMGMELASGRNFSKTFGTDSSAMLINETAARVFGWGDKALGHTITHKENNGVEKTFHVVGIVKDFHFRSLHELITPLLMTLGNNSGTMIVKTKTKDIAPLIAHLQNEWAAFKPDAAFSWSFLDDRFSTMYRAENNISVILGIFSGLTIFVACLGLFGLTIFSNEQRRKEIGVRKVLGANVSGLVALLSKDFLKLVCIAFVASAPIAWWVMNKWLQDFAYRINIGAWLFVAAAGLAILITVVTVGVQAVKAALANPVRSLRSE